jgi:hypothetical protein
MKNTTLYVLAVSLALLACKKKSHESATTGISEAPAPPAVAAVPSSVASTTVANIAEPATGDEGARDAGPLRARRAKRALDAGTALAPEPPPPEVAAPPATARDHGRRGTPMKSDDPYGAVKDTSDPALKRAPLPSDDPWGRGGSQR